MKKTQGRYSALSRVLAFLLAFVMVAGYLPTTNVWTASAAELTPGSIETVADPETLTRPTDIYGNHTLNAGKVTVGKSVATHDQTVKLGTNGKFPFTAKENNFTVTISQFAQVMGLSTETSVPVDVVFVLDTSGSMSESNRETTMVTAVNRAISTLMAANANNRVGVVAFSDIYETGNWWNAETGPAAQVLSPLASYTGEAATDHLGWSDSNIVGRGTNAGSRDGSNGGTNIQAGVVMGAKMLASATDLTVDGVSRMPFLIILSDGAPTYNFSSTNWYDPSMTGSQYGPGNDEGTLYTGNGFLPALVAAYYKGVITEHYFGTNASEENRCNIYTLGVSIDNSDLAKLTMDPNANFNANATGYSHAGRFATYWRNYQAGSTFNISCDNGDNLSITKTTIDATKNYVNGISSSGKTMYSGGIQYNDGYYSATSTNEINSIFTQVVTEISKKAISSPTKVDAYGADFSGYVTFADPIGEYMEVKDMKGLVIGDYFYQGESAAEYMAAYGTADQDAEFNALMEKVLTTRMSMTASSGVTMADLMNTVDGNSITWWGKTYDVSGEEDVGMQVIAPADDDSVDYITSTTPPAGADHVCRSYFFYGEAGGANLNPDHEMMYFMVRVQRSLEAPYQQTVVISCPASLLSMEKVLITENSDGTFTASVEEAEPARVVYEVGLRSDINAENVAAIVSSDYKAEAPAIDEETGEYTGSVNYDPDTDTYSFFTNDWNRDESVGSHHRAMTKATFDAAADNSFYTYQQDTLIVNDRGEAVTSDPKGTTAYYFRTYYEWGSTADSNGDYAATPKTKLIKVDIPSNANLVQKDGKWYIPKGTYTASTLQTNGDDVIKGDDPNTTDVEKNNVTGTSEIVSHAHRTGDASNSHYTVLLGNNGMLTLKANTPEPKKTVQVNNDTVDANGKEVKIGDQLTYTIRVENTLDRAAEYTITDKVPAGTKFVSADNDGRQTNGTVTWKVNIPAGQPATVNMVVEVTEDALNTAVVPGTIKNTAVVTFPNGAEYSTNPVENPPYGKQATDANGNDTANSGYKVGDIITYSIRYHNNAKNDQGQYADADITITDIVPKGTELVSNNPISHNGVTSVNDQGQTVITWTFENVRPNMAGVVTFRVKITADAVSPVTNSADIVLNNDPDTKITTNPTETNILKGDLVLTKTVAEGDKDDGTFELTLQESTGKLTGTFAATYKNGTSAGNVSFNNTGYAVVGIKAGEEITIKDLPAGVKITVAENATAGWTPTYNGASTAQEVTIVAGDVNKATVNVNNDYHAKPVTFQLKGTKTFVGTNFPAGVTFSFQAVQCNSDGSALTGATPITVYADVTSPNGQIAFSPREFTAAFDEPRYYKITEDASTIPGLITDSSEYLLELNVTDNGSGDLELTYTLSKGANVISTNNTTDGVKTGTVTVEGANFTNTYPDSTSITLGGDKTLNGRHQKPGEFDFQLLVPVGQVGSNEATVIDTATNVPGSNAHNGTFAFNTITYTAADMVNEDGTIATEKTFTYYIREVPGNASFTTYDPAYFVVTVTVKNVNGKLEASKSIVKYENAADDTPDTVTAIAFSNKFQVQDTRVTLTGTKNLEGRNLVDGEFSFSVYHSDVNGTIGALASSGVNDDTAIYFAPIGFSIADMDGANSKDFYFVVQEDRPAEDGATFDPNMYYDPTAYLVKVAVSYNEEDGSLTAQPPAVVKVNKAGTWENTTGADATLVFSNIQNPDRITVTPVGTKKISGSNLPEGLSFSFKVVPVAGGKDAATGTSTPITSSYVSNSAIDVGFTSMVYSYDLWNANKDASGVATFRYWILESNTGSAGNGVDYTTVRYLYEVKVSRTATNALVTTETYYKQNANVDDGNTDAANYTTMIETYTSTEDENARAEFINAVKADVIFSNNYHAEIQINLTATKVLEKDNLEAREFDFILQRYNKDGALVDGSEVSGSHDAAAMDADSKKATATIRFATLNYTSGDGSILSNYDSETDNDGNTCWYINYLMSEVKPTDVAIPGVTYDPNQYIVTIKVTQMNGEDADSGTLTAEISNVKHTDGTPVTNFAGSNTNVTFTNTYSVQTGVAVTIEATKTLTGRDFVMNNGVGEFGFVLYRQGKDAQNNIVWHNIGTAFNNEQGEIKFTRQYNASTLSHMANEFDDVDNDGKEEYVVIYRINEINGGLGGVTYSGAAYYAKVIIEHDEDNSKYLCESVTYYTDEACEQPVQDNNSDGKVDGKDVIFANTYKTNDTSFKPTASKELKVWDAETKQYKNASAAGFSFEVVEVDSAGNPIMIGEEGKKYAKVVATGHSNSDGTVTFDDVIFNGQLEVKCENKSNTNHYHYYMIRENQGTAQGVTYDTENYYIRAAVTDDGTGNMTVVETYYKTAADMVNGINAINGSDALFTNYYGPGTENLDLQVNKVVKVEYPQQARTFALRGTPVIDPNAKYEMAGSEFDFEVYKADASFNRLKDANDKYIVVASGTNGAGSGEATVSFTTITYTRKDAYANGNVVSGQQSSQTYYYVIKELTPSEGSVPGVAIDNKDICVTVTVSDDGYGNMSVTAVYANDDKTFTNTYKVKDPVTVTLTAVKELIGKDMETFRFILQNKDNAEEKYEVTNNGTGITFPELTFNLPGTYTYTVSEVNEGKDNMTYDATVYTVTVKVMDDREGKLYTEVTMSKPDENDAPVSVELMKFTNTYKHPALTKDLSAQISAEKTVVGENGQKLDYLLKEYQFRFKVVDLQNQPVLGKPNADGTRLPVVGTSNEDGDITFSEFYFTTVGEYHYLIREIEDPAYADKKITTDGQVWCAHIKVVYNRATGLLEIDPEGCTTHLYNAAHDADQEYTAPVFENKYKPESVTVTVKANKELTGRELKGNEFTFRLLDGNNIAAEAKNNADGSITFQLNYELADLAGKSEETFTYKLVEVEPDTKLGGVTYSEMTATVKVKVTDNQEGKLTAAVTGNGVTFTNEYNAEKVTAVIEAVKVLDGRNLEGNEFSFYLKDEDGNTVKDADGNDLIVKNDADGKIRFEMEFTQDKLDVDDKGNHIPTDFAFTIHEVEGDLPGVTYTDSWYAVTVTVRDNYQGKLIATTTYTDGVTPTFTNVYETDDALVTIKATKKLTGENLAGDDFEFQLKDEAGNVVKTVKNDAQGNIVFQIALDEAKDYTFTIVEVAHADKHYSHDDSTYKVTVKVKDNGEGKLIAEDPVYEKTPVFENTYSPDSIYVTVEASKTLSGGKALKADAFEFQLLVKDEVVDTAKNGADGKIKFEIPYEFKDLGGEAEKTFTYTMVEKAGNNPDRYDYDSNKYTVTVKLVNDNGVLKATVTYGTTDGKAPVFKNTWKPEKIGISLTGTKTLTGRDMKAGEFKFQVHDSTDTLVATGTNDAKGKITFTPVGIVTKGTYLLTVSEVKGSAEYVTYDKTTFQVKVVVENVDGVLTPTVTYLDGDIAFENSYDEPANPETGDNAPIYWMIGLLVVSALAIVLLIVLRPKKGGKYAK